MDRDGNPPASERRRDPAIIAHCRAGFEAEAGADLMHIASAARTTLVVDAPVGRGFVVAAVAHFNAERWAKALASATPLFVRSLFLGGGPHALLDPNVRAAASRPDRVTPLVALIDKLRADLPALGLQVSTMFSEIRLETPDTNDGKALSGLCRALDAPLTALAHERGVLVRPPDDASGSQPRLHVLFVDGAHVYLGISVPPWSSPWLMGIPRLRMPRGAPSRSTLKLAEALVVFLGADETESLRAGMRAVDLGAAPGGWTWQLAHRGLRVTAVDNGPLKGEVADDPLVTHVRVDGLTYRPRRPVDWLVCDMAEQPARVAALVARWIGEGHARRAIFNLKLPMKKRYEEIVRCREIIEQQLRQARVAHRLSFRQLYHDREEVTGFVERSGPR